jgi:hypothetical protein
MSGSHGQPIRLDSSGYPVDRLLFERLPPARRPLFSRTRTFTVFNFWERRMCLACRSWPTISQSSVLGQRSQPTTFSIGWGPISSMPMMAGSRRFPVPYESTSSRTSTLINRIRLSVAPMKGSQRSGGSTPVPALTQTTGM